MSKFEFNHDSKSTLEACGIDLKETLIKVRPVLEKAAIQGKSSVVVEGLMNNLTKRELAFIAHLGLGELTAMLGNMVSEFISTVVDEEGATPEADKSEERDESFN